MPSLLPRCFLSFSLDETQTLNPLWVVVVVAQMHEKCDHLEQQMAQQLIGTTDRLETLDDRVSLCEGCTSCFGLHANLGVCERIMLCLSRALL